MRPLKRNVRGAARRERVRVDFVERWARGAQRREPTGQLAPVRLEGILKRIFIFVLIFMTFPIMSYASEHGIKDIYGKWILVDVKNGDRMQYHIGLLKLRICENAFEMKYSNFTDGGQYTTEKNLISFKSKMRRNNYVLQFLLKDELLSLQEPGKNEIMYFKKGVKPEFYINSGQFDNRFNSPEKTYVLFKMLLSKRKINQATECLMPTMAGLYHKNFAEMIKANKFDSFWKGLPEKIVFSSEYDPYYDYNLISEVGGRKISYPIQFIKLPSGIFLLYHL